MILTTRQLASIIWLAIFVCWALSIKGVRSSVRSILATLFSPKILGLFAFIIGYNITIIWGLWRVGYWDATMLYDSVIFVTIGSIGSVFKASEHGVTYDWRFFSKTILVNLEIMVIFSFLLDFFPFNFWVEFLLVIPLTTLLVMLLVVAEHRKDTKQVHRLLSSVQSFIGLLLIGYITWRIFKGYRQLMHIQVLFSLLLPFVMSVFFLPVLFIVCAFFAYENAFCVASFKSGDDKRWMRWKKWRLLLRFGLNLKALQMFRRSVAFHKYRLAKNMEEALVHLDSWSDGIKSADYLDL